jgi:asparagine synthase (glutamine-hydrolysing)
VLSGYGSDNYLAFPPLYLADDLARGRLRDGARHLADLAIAERRSFWGLGFDYAVYPLLPRRLRRRWANPASALPAWIDPEFAREHELADRALRLDAPRTGGGVFADQMAIEMTSIDLALEPDTCRQGVEIRYPFLHRPLVEFCLRLPPVTRSRPAVSKWIQREALADLLPDAVRRRRGKGGIDARIFWSLNQEQTALTRLIDQSSLADLGCVDRGELRRTFARSLAGDARCIGPLFVGLALDTWLAIRAGTWSSTFPNRRPAAAGSLTRKESRDETAIR